MAAEMRQIALDALGYTNEIEKKIALNDVRIAYLEKTNPLKSYTGDGKGMKLRAHSSEHPDSPYIADNTQEFHALTRQLASDAVEFNIPSNGVPPVFTSIFTNKFIKQVFQTTPFRTFTKDFQQGEWGETTNIYIPAIGMGGDIVLYGDTSPLGNTDVNANWINREVVYLQEVLDYGDLNVTQMSMAKIDYAARLRESAATMISLNMNQIGFSGYAGKEIYGLLNDPGLNPTVVFPASAAVPSSSLWIYKTYFEITDDIRSLYNSAISIAGGNLTFEDPAYLGIPPSAYMALTQQSTYSVTVMEFIKKVFPNLEIVQVQNYQGTGTPPGSTTSSYCQLIFKEFGGQDVALNTFVSPYHSHGVIRQLSSYAEKVSYAFAGATITQPIAVATGSGL